MTERKTASIVTMHFPCNYGAVLQAYALSHYLRDEGLEVRIVDYVPVYFREKLSLWYVGNERCRHNPLLRLGYYLLRIPPRVRERMLFSQFRSGELEMTEPLSQEDLLQGGKVSCDYYFCGSDQIWNEKNETLADPVYFLQFAAPGAKRISYAASGTVACPFSEKVRQTVLPWLSEFDAISVREDTMRDNLRAALGTDVRHVCDPVFLLGKNAWKSLAEKGGAKGVGHPYILVYAIGNDPTPYERARELGDKLSLPVYSMGLVRKPGVNRNLNCSPYRFLKLFEEAQCVVTNSFHGFSFSLIFNRPFWVCDTSIANHRLRSLLSKTGTESRFLRKGEAFSCDDKIDWDSVNDRLVEFVDSSKTFIKNSISI